MNIVYSLTRPAVICMAVFQLTACSTVQPLPKSSTATPASSPTAAGVTPTKPAALGVAPVKPATVAVTAPPPIPAPTQVSASTHLPNWAQSGPAVLPRQPLQALNADAALTPSIAVTTIETPNDLWDRMRRGFGVPDLDSQLVRHKEHWYSNRPDYFDRMVNRGSKYLFHIVEEVERRQMPQELALLPFIESAFNPQAVSHAKAAGMWQFMPATGRHFDLKQNAFRDDRRDVLASTRAALDYLQYLHNMFGDWHLALAAYNWGEGNVQRAIRRNREAGLPTGYNDLRMPTETREYVPKLQAVKNIVAQPQRFAVNLPKVGNHPYFDSVNIDRDMDVALIAELAEVSEADFRQLNPSYNKPVIMAAGTSSILLPWDNALLFMDRLKDHKGPTATWTVWRVPSQMSVSAAAKKHNLSEDRLRAVNKIPPRMSLRAGSTILVPRQGSLDRDVPEHVADRGQILLISDSGPSRKVKVKKGDTLSLIARRYGVSTANLMKWNGLSASSLIRVGQTLIVQAGGSSVPKNSSARPKKNSAPAPKAGQSRPSKTPVR